MLTDDERLLAVRASRKYRAGIWLVRIANVIGLPWMALLFSGVVPESTDPFYTAFFIVTVGPALFFLFTSGIPINRTGVRWLVEPRAARLLFRDIFWRRPR